MLIANALSNVGVLSKKEEKKAVNQYNEVIDIRDLSICCTKSSKIIKAGDMVIKIPKNKTINSQMGSQE